MDYSIRVVGDVRVAEFREGGPHKRITDFFPLDRATGRVSGHALCLCQDCGAEWEEGASFGEGFPRECRS